jgi:alpha-beta hydrolase superfamily lysophospholipase
MNFSFFARIRWLAVLATICTLGGCAYIETKQGEWIFNPAQGEWRGFRGLPDGFSEVWIPVGNRGERLNAWWAPAANKDAPVLLYLHGARWDLTGSVTRIPRWNRMGFSVLAIDYRGFGKSIATSSDVPSERSANEDAAAAWTHLATLAPGSKRFIFGHSLGGSMALHLALNQPDTSGVILEGAFTSIPDMIRETRWGFLPVAALVTQRFDNVERINSVTMPVLVAHGTADSIVPFSMGEKLFAAAKSPKKFLRAEGGSHHNLTANFFDQYRQAIEELFGLNLGEDKTRVVLEPALGSISR